LPFTIIYFLHNEKVYIMAKPPLSAKTTSEDAPAPEGAPAPAVLDAAFFDAFFSEVLPVLGGGTFYQPSAWEHYAKAEYSDPISGAYEHGGWKFTLEGGKLLFAEKLRENATSELTE